MTMDAIPIDRLSQRNGVAALVDPSDKKLQEAAREFEAILVETMIQSMRKMVEEEEEEGESFLGGETLGKETYYDLMYQQLARAISSSARLGIEEMIQEKVKAMEGAQKKSRDLRKQEISLEELKSGRVLSDM